MAATSPQDLLDTLLSATAIDSAGVKIGAVRQVYIDDASGKATFATVATGVFSSDAIVPLYGARLLDRELHVDHTRQSVRDSPRPDHSEDGLTPDQEAELMEHYGVEAESADTGTDTDTGAGTGTAAAPAPKAGDGGPAGGKAGDKAGNKNGITAEGTGPATGRSGSSRL